MEIACNESLNYMSSILEVRSGGVRVELAKNEAIHNCHLHKPKEELPPPFATLSDEGIVDAILISAIHAIH